MIGYLDIQLLFFRGATRRHVVNQRTRYRKNKESIIFATEEIFIENTWKSNEACRGWYTSSIHNDTQRKKRIKLRKRIVEGRRKKILNAVSRGCKLCTPIHRTGGQVKVSQKTTTRNMRMYSILYVYLRRCRTANVYFLAACNSTHLLV